MGGWCDYTTYRYEMNEQNNDVFWSSVVAKGNYCAKVFRIFVEWDLKGKEKTK